ncbi:hypothetical protein Tco_0319011 [Tanacetum coccineum]
MEAGSLPSSTKTNPRGLARAITIKSGLNYKPPKNPLENNTNPQDKPVTNETITRNEEEVPDGHRNTVESCIPPDDLLAKKGKAEETSKRTLNERCSVVLLNKIPLLENDSGSFTLPCAIGKLSINKALADLRASINLMPYSMFSRLDLGELKPTRKLGEIG